VSTQRRLANDVSPALPENPTLPLGKLDRHNFREDL
jgi:hypothetical protein